MKNTTLSKFNLYYEGMVSDFLKSQGIDPGTHYSSEWLGTQSQNTVSGNISNEMRGKIQTCLDQSKILKRNPKLKLFVNLDQTALLNMANSIDQEHDLRAILFQLDNGSFMSFFWKNAPYHHHILDAMATTDNYFNAGPAWTGYIRKNIENTPKYTIKFYEPFNPKSRALVWLKAHYPDFRLQTMGED
jgi:hypothetical protein